MSNVHLGVNVKALIDETNKKYLKEIECLNNQIKELQGMVLYERERREYAEHKLQEYELEMNTQKDKHRSKKDTKPQEYSEYTSRGVRKKSHVESIQSYTDFKNIQDYYLQRKDVTGYVLWTVGVCIGVRISDLNILKWKNILNEDLSFKKRIKIYEKKTNKLQNCLITEGVVRAITMLADSLSWNIKMDDYIFANPATGNPYNSSTWYRKINAAAKACRITYNVGTHTMRESFANIILCVDNHSVDMNSITKIQGLLNHSDPRVTMKYLGKLDEMYDQARETVSNFVLGKTNVDKLIYNGTVSISDMVNKLDEIESKLQS